MGVEAGSRICGHDARGLPVEQGAPRWYVVLFESGKHVSAAAEIVACGFSAYVPMIIRRRVMGSRLVETPVPRYLNYLFAAFDVERDDWMGLMRPSGKRAGIVRVLGNNPAKPMPVPSEVVAAIRAYEPPAEARQERYRYRSGEECKVIIGGVHKRAVFIGYQGQRQFVRTWVFGAEHVVEVRAADMEPLALDT